MTEDLRNVIVVYAEISSHVLLITPERRRGSAGAILLNLLCGALLADNVQLLRKWRFTSAGGYENRGEVKTAESTFLAKTRLWQLTRRKGSGGWVGVAEL